MHAVILRICLVDVVDALSQIKVLLERECLELGVMVLQR